MSKIDLHLHTNLSDGLLSPENVIILAKENGCQTIAITDHELCENYELLSQKYDINIISGIEFNTSISNLHLLGYGIIDFDKMNAEMLSLRKLNEVICIEVIERLRKDGIEVSIKQLKDYLDSINLDSQILDKRKLVKYLIHMGYSSTIVETYQKLIGKGQKYYVPNIKLSPKEIIELVKSCGGKTVLAHPNTITKDNKMLLSIVDELKSLGLFGMEVKNDKMKLTQTEFYQIIAYRNELLETFGSDFHNPNTDYVGVEIEQEKYKKIHEKLVLKRKL